MTALAARFTPQRIERTIEVCAAIYIAMLFTRWGEIPAAAAWVGALVWLFGAPKPYLAALGRDRLVQVWLALLAWALASAAWSVNGAATLADWYASFDDHLLAVPLLVHLLATGRAAKLARMLAWAAIVVIVLNALQYLGDIGSGAIAAPDNWVKHRKWAYPLVLFAPFLMLQAVRAVGRARLLWSAALLATAFMVLGSGARGAWLALAVAAAVFGGWLLRKQRRAALGALAALALALPLFLLLPQGAVVKQRLAQGFDTTGRVAGTWRPALDMTAQRPWLGHGLGMRVYHDEYLRQAGSHPHWFFGNKPMSPHNFFLMALFGLGLPGLALSLLLAWQLAARFLVQLRTAAPPDAFLPLALLASFVAHYLVRGSFETLSWSPLAIYVGCAAGLALAPRDGETA